MTAPHETALGRPSGAPPAQPARDRRARRGGRPDRAGRWAGGWTDPVTWGPRQLGAFLCAVAVLALLVFRALGG